MTGTLSGIRVWDGFSDRGASEIYWQDGVLTTLRPSDPADRPEREGLCVIPGLVDTHVHLLGFAGGRDAASGFDTFTWPLVTIREEQTLHAAANAQRAMRAGVTTLRDLGADEAQAAVARVFDARVMIGPRVIAYGPVGMTAGHLDLFTPRAVRDRPPTADGPDACRALVRRWARSGLTGIKIYTSGGVLSMGDAVGWRNHTRAEINASVDEAHALGMLVACHTHSAEGIAIALEEGVDSIEHGTGMTADQAVELANRGISVAPTLLINDMIAGGAFPVPEESRRIAAELMVHRDRELLAAARAGVEFVLGTDANGYLLEFGDEWDELRRMSEVLGWDAQRTLRAGTSAAARAVRSPAGVLEVGRPADFVVMNGDPVGRVDDLRVENVVAVVCRGVLVAGELPR
jgi:imidazolonepropionase-like amidohydrolase